MTNAEMNRRLATMSPELLEQVKQMVRDGFGAVGITLGSPATLKQANAVFQLVQETVDAKRAAQIAANKKRIAIERRIVRVAVRQLLREGFTLGVDYSDDKPEFHNKEKPILDLLFDLDDAHLVARRLECRGWVRFVFGNDGYDVIADYTVNLEPHISEAEALAEKLSN